MNLLNLKTILYRLELETLNLVPPVKDAELVRYQGLDYNGVILFEQSIWVSRYDNSVCWHRWSSDVVKDRFEQDKAKISKNNRLDRWMMVDHDGTTYQVMNISSSYFRVKKT